MRALLLIFLSASCGCNALVGIGNYGVGTFESGSESGESDSGVLPIADADIGASTDAIAETVFETGSETASLFEIPDASQPCGANGLCPSPMLCCLPVSWGDWGCYAADSAACSMKSDSGARVLSCVSSGSAWGRCSAQKCCYKVSPEIVSECQSACSAAQLCADASECEPGKTCEPFGFASGVTIGRCQ